MPSLTSSLPQLRETLASLDSYELPDRYKPLLNSESASSSTTDDTTTSTNTSSSNNENMKNSTIDPTLFQRYLKAKDTYLRKRMNHLFIEHLSTLQYNKNNNNNKENMTNNNSSTSIQISLPSKPTSDEIHELNVYKQNVTKNLISNIHKIRTSYDNVYNKYKTLNDKKDDIRGFIETLEDKQRMQRERMEKKSRNNNDKTTKSGKGGVDESMDETMDFDYDIPESNNNHDDDNVVDADQHLDESELMLEEEKLRDLREKKAMLEMKLHKLQMEKELVKCNIEKDQQLVQDLIHARGSGGQSKTSDSDGFSTTIDLKNLPSIEEIENETKKLQEQSRTYQEMAEYYDSIKCTMEVLGGMKILSISPVKQSSVDQGSDGTDIGEDVNVTSPSSSPSNINSSSSTEKSQPSPLNVNDDNEMTKNQDMINLKVLLLDHHIVNLTLIANHSPSSPTTITYRVKSAVFETSTVITETIHDDDCDSNKQMQSVSMSIPPLDDLVNLSKNMQPLDDIRFVLRETMARVRSISRRVDVLAQLKLKYLTKITDPMKNKIQFGFGGEYQEVVCSLPCQITVVLRLTCDCPLLIGSVSIHQIVGVSGWDKDCLERMKNKVNMTKWRSPVDVMDALENEIERVTKDEGISLPKTPTLPEKKR